MLIKCAECNREISDQAEACPGCGAPIKQAEKASDVQTIELTGKKWKLAQLLGGIAAVWGFFAMIGGNNEAVFFFVAGIAIYIYARFGRWWHHG